MVGKAITAKSFGGCLRYVLGKGSAHLLDASEGLCTDRVAAMIQDFNLQRLLNPNLGKAVGHSVLSWHQHDAPKLTQEAMAERAREYMALMGIRETQYAVVQHTDRPHPHLHIVYNRVDNQGHTISDKNNYKRNEKACKLLTAKYGYTYGKDKEQVSRERLKGSEKVRYELFDTIKACVRQATSWQQLEAYLARQGVELQYKYKGQTNQVQGISFSLGEVKFKGSAIDRSLSYASLDRQLQENMEQWAQAAEEAEAQLRQENRPVITESKEQTPEQIPSEETKPGSWQDWLHGFGGTGDVDDEQAHKRWRSRGR